MDLVGRVDLVDVVDLVDLVDQVHQVGLADAVDLADLVDPVSRARTQGPARRTQAPGPRPGPMTPNLSQDLGPNSPTGHQGSGPRIQRLCRWRVATRLNFIPDVRQVGCKLN